MTTETTIYAPPAPEYGDRFARMWADYNTRDRLDLVERWERWLRTAQIALGALAGLVIAGWLA